MQKFTKQELDKQADQIEYVLERHRIRGHVRGGTITPRLVQFEYVPSMGVRVKKVSRLSAEIAMALGSQDVRITRKGNAITIEIPRAKTEPIRLLRLCQNIGDVPKATAVLGIDESGHPLLLKLTSPDVAHVLIAGTTGSGKTSLARSLMASLALFNSPDELNFVLIDPKRRGFYALANLPHTIGEVADDVPTAIAQLERAVTEMERRDKAGEDQPMVVLAVDELADLIQSGGSAVERMLARLAQRGRQAGFHLVACTQKPTAAMIGSSMVANFPIRLVGAVASKDEARYATGIADSGADKLGGKGDFLLIAKGNALRFQAGWLGSGDFQTIMETVCDAARDTNPDTNPDALGHDMDENNGMVQIIER